MRKITFALLISFVCGNAQACDQTMTEENPTPCTAASPLAEPIALEGASTNSNQLPEESKIVREIERVADQLDREIPRIQEQIERETTRVAEQLDREAPKVIETVAREGDRVVQQVSNVLRRFRF